MNALDRVREKYQIYKEGTCKTSETPSAGFAGTQDRNLENPNVVQMAHFDTERASEAMVRLMERREERRRQVLEMQALAPMHKTHFVLTEIEEDVVIVTIGIRDIGTCELTIKREAFDPFRLLEALEEVHVPVT